MKVIRFRIPLIIATIALFAALYLYQEVTIAGEFGFPVDDAWIHFQFARNLADGYGLSYNHDVPMSGSTAPLWTFILAGSRLLHLNMVYAAKAAGLILYALSCIMVYKIVLYMVSDKCFALLGALLAAMISKLMWGALSGMEVMLSVFLTLLGVYLHMLFRRESGLKQYASTVAFALASLARPESLQLIFLAVLDGFLLNRVERREPLTVFARRTMTHLLLFLLLLAPYFYFNYSITGELFPNTFAAKRGGGIFVALAERDLGELRKVISFYPRIYLSNLLDLSRSNNLLLYWLMFIGTVYIIVSSLRKKSESRATIIPLIFFLYFPISGMVAPCKMVLQGSLRYVGNLMALFVIMGTVGLYAVHRYLKTLLADVWVSEKMAGRIQKGILVAVVFVLTFSLAVEEYENSKFFALGVQNINSMHVRIGRWAKEHTAPDAVLAINDIGAIAFFSERKIIDLVGLVTPEIIPYKQDPDDLFTFVSRERPDYVIVYDRWFNNFRGYKELEPLFEVTLERNAVCGDATMVVYKANWNAGKP